MRFLDELLDGGAGYSMKRVDGGAVLSPAGQSDAAVTAFQHIVERVRAHEGEGYRIHLTHTDSDRPGDLVDRVVLTLDE